MKKALLSFSTLVILGLWITLLVWGQTPTAVPVQPVESLQVERQAPPAHLVDPSILEFIKVFGFGAMIFIIWWGDYRKIAELKTIVGHYEKLAVNYETITKECRDTMLLTMDVNAKLVTKLEYLLPVSRSSERPNP